MWLEHTEEFFKGFLPYYVLIFLPIFIIISPANPVAASHEFPVYRMQHFDLHGVSHGCRSASINLEARSLMGWTTSRHCVVTKLKDLTVDHFMEIRNKAGALLVVLPNNLSKLSKEDKHHLVLLENAMMMEDIKIPVYFCKETKELNNIVKEVGTNNAADDKKISAAEAMLASVSANGYQIVVSPKTPSAKTDVKVATIQGNLVGHSADGKIPTIAIVAHYDSFGVAPDLAFGADSNGSGVAMLLELVRLFSVLYSDPKTHGKFNIVFLLTGAGKLNYQGSKKWLEDQLDSLDGSIIQEASYVMCLDSTASSSSLYMHVSKPPKEGSAASIFFNKLKLASDSFVEASVEGVHKKINLADDLLAWEHERFSIRRLPSFTLSSLKSHKDFKRSTILDVRDNLSLDTLVQNTQIVADALANHIYNLTGGAVFGNSLKVERNAVEAWLDYLSSQSRSAQMLSNKDNVLVSQLKDTFGRYLRDVKITYAIPDKRDPEFVFYDVTQGTMNVYSVKPAFFDLILTMGIVAYLVTIYFAIQKFPVFYTIACSITKNKKQN
ncbi:PREDICTED: nicalin [Nicrophorus vespilloides]|uniref:Nicalin n=1 Tax=Nicrophorus vespilloides TaxID=110193 RepID=A0ABM1NJH0_NICVS|nr:PREDICTED: nicalin [Nicrophorus vespilloides]